MFTSKNQRSNKYFSNNGNHVGIADNEGVRIVVNGVTNYKIDDDDSAAELPTLRNNQSIFSSRGVQVKEKDEGQPCLECSNCLKGYVAHSWRKNCKNCKCPRDSHSLTSEHGAKSRLGFANTNENVNSGLGYAFVPSGLNKAQQVTQFYSLLPNHEVPTLGSQGAVARSQRLIKQLPKQDLVYSACKFVDPSEKNSFQDFIAARNEIALDIGFVKNAPPNSKCTSCTQIIPAGQFSISALKLGDMLWHPACFRCSTCDDLLVDLAYCVHDDKIYCERHYAECLKPRCESCDEVRKNNKE